MTKILIVEDRQKDGLSLRTVLEGNGYDIAVAANGHDALELARRDPPNIIVADIVKPFIDAFSLCHTWNQDLNLKEIPFVFYTATYTEPRDRDLALSLGAVEFILGSDGPGTLLEKLLDVIENPATGDPTKHHTAENERRTYQHEYNVSRDITERVRTEAALQKSEMQYRTLVESLPAMVVVYRVKADQPFAPEYMSPNIEALGFTMDEWYKTPDMWLKRIHPGDRERVLREGAAARRDMREVEYEYRLIAANGSVRWIHDRGSFVLDDHGVAISWQGVMIDITERKCAEDALRQLASIVQFTDDAIVSVTPSRLISSWNRGAEKLYGYSADEIMGESITRIIPKHRAAEMITIRDRVLHGDPVEHFETERVRKDGTIITVSTTLSPMLDASSNVIGISSIARDMTDRKKEEAFRAGQNRILEMIARGAHLEDVLTSLVLLIESQSSSMIGSVLLLDEDGVHISHGAAPSLPQPWNDHVNGMSIGPRAGSCGTAMFTGKQVIVSDILTDPLWEDYHHMPTEYGLRACWSTPIIAPHGKVLGTFAMYYRSVRSPTVEEMRLIDVAVHIAGIAIERKRAEEALRASERRFAVAFQSNPTVLSINTLEEGRFLAVNEQFLRATGFSRSDVIGHTSPELHFWHGPETRAEALEKLKVDGCLRDQESTYRTKFGDLRAVLFSLELIELEGRECVLLAATDITERKRAEEELSLLQTITTEIAEAPDLSSALEIVLLRVCEKTGWVLGQVWVPGQAGTVLECANAKCMNGDGLENFRTFSLRATFAPGIGLPGRVWQSKQPAWVPDVTVDTNFPRAIIAREVGLKSGVGIPIQWGGNVVAVLEFFMREKREEDERLVKLITTVTAQLGLFIERKQAAEAYRLLVEHSLQGLVIVQNEQIVVANTAAGEILGYTVDELLSLSAEATMDLLHPADRALIHERIGVRVAGQPVSLRFETLAIRKDGETCWLDVSATLFEYRGKPAVQTTIMDISERKRADEQLNSSREQLRALSARLQLAREEEGTRIAREIHDALGAALTGLKWDLEGIDSSLATAQNGNLQRRTLHKKIAGMTKLLDFTIETVRKISSELRPSVLDDFGLAAAIEWQSQQFQARTNIRCDFQSALDDAQLSRERATAVFRIFQEILTNVLRHAHATEVEVTMAEEDGFIMLRVNDNGRGITAKEKTDIRSLGILGMQERAQLAGGEISIQGSKGVGTRVTVRVPVREPEGA